MLNKGSLYIISAPSGAGKTTLVRALMEEVPNIVPSVSYTTRKMRPNEQEGVDYHFVTEEEFNNMIKKNVFLEHATVYGNKYGTSKLMVEAALLRGTDVLLEIDWQGAKQVRTQFVEAISIFILPPSRESLSERLKKRHLGNSEMIEERMKEAKEQLSRYTDYDYLICNDQFEAALEDLKSIVRCQRLYWRRQKVQQSVLLKELLS